MITEGNEKLPVGRDGGVLWTLVIGLVFFSLLLLPVSAAKLATSELISPANDQHFYALSSELTLAWKPVPGATSYRYEMEWKALGSDWVPLPGGTITQGKRVSKYIPSSLFPEQYQDEDFLIHSR